MKKRTLLLVPAALIPVAALVLVVRLRPHSTPAAPPLAKAAPAPIPATSDRPALERYVARNAAAKSPEAQDRLGAARLRLGYAVARTEGFAKARQAFLAVARDHKGTGAQSAAFGGVADGAAYQAAVCLVGEGKKAEAEGEFVRFLEERPLSPLVHAVRGRLVRLNGGEAKPQWDALLQADVAKQEARIRFETSVCGPKCLERLTGKSYKELAKLCGTTDSGTSVEGMRRGLKALGRESWAVRLDRRDLADAKLPAVLLQGDHYVVLERVEGDKATVWDPRFKASSALHLPSLDDPDFTATLILLSKPEGL